MNSERHSRVWLRWLAFFPAGVVAWLLAVAVAVLLRGGSTSIATSADQFAALSQHAFAACVGTAVGIAVAPSHHKLVALFWAVLFFFTACYGNLVQGAGILPPHIAYVNILGITFGAVCGGVVASVWSRRMSKAPDVAR